LETQTQKGAIEAIIFASGEPIPLEKIAAAMEQGKTETKALVAAVMEEFNQMHSGIQIIQINDSYQMCTKAEFESYIRLALELKNNTPLSAAALEVLAIVAYHQPVTKAFLEQVRGVDSSGVLNGLFAKGLVEERGRLELPGRPLLYGTTQNFLRCMGLSSLEELPEVPDPKDTAEQANENDAADAADDKQLKLEDV
jgi:segregation and condensation protein B